MRSRLTRLGVVAVGILALLGVATPPAHAATVAVVAFGGTATLGAPIGYPCVGGQLVPTAPVPSIDTPGTGKCNPATWGPKAPGTLDLTVLNLTNVRYPFLNLPNRTTFAFVTTTCLMVVAHIAKPAPKGTDVHPGACTIRAAGTVKGFCGLSQGHGTATITDPLGLSYTVTFHFTAVGGTLVVDGQVTKSDGSQLGHFIGLVEAIPPLPTVTAGSCATKSARTFTIAGGGVAVTT